VLADVVNSAVQDEEWKGSSFEVGDVTIDEAISVFCDKNLLAGAIRHSIDNIVDPRHRAPNAYGIPRLHISTMQSGGHSILLVISNDKTKPKPDPGFGLQEWSRRLRPFGATIAGGVVDSTEWSYQATINLTRW